MLSRFFLGLVFHASSVFSIFTNKSATAAKTLGRLACEEQIVKAKFVPHVCP